ncbi:MAG: hypothetical protein RIT81_14585 [Deltaproteobacteria bacterium]
MSMKFQVGSIVIDIVLDQAFMARVQGPWGRVSVSIASVALATDEFTALYPVLVELRSLHSRLSHHGAASTPTDPTYALRGELSAHFGPGSKTEFLSGWCEAFDAIEAYVTAVDDTYVEVTAIRPSRARVTVRRDELSAWCQQSILELERHLV